MSPAAGHVVRGADLADPADRSHFARLMAEFAAEPVSASPELGVAHFERVARDLAHRPGTLVLLASRGARGDAALPEGVLVAFEGYSTFSGAALLNVHDVHVSMPARGLGLGTSLMRALEEVGRRRGCARITLEVAATNEGAIRLYRRLGYAGLGSAAGDATYFAKKALARD